jgi:hypothetical protein
MRNLLLALALFTTPAFAQGTETDPQPAPGSIAIGMIEAANAQGVFDVVPDGHVSVRHLGSGLVCHFTDNAEGGRVIVFPQLARGEDVGCDLNPGNASITLYATRYPFASNLDEQLAGAEAAIRQRFTDARPSNVTTASAANVPQRASAFLIAMNGAPRFTSVHIAQIGDWTIKQRYTARAATDTEIAAASQAATAHFAATLADIASPPNL